MLWETAYLSITSLYLSYHICQSYLSISHIISEQIYTCAGAVARFVIGPLDVLKIRFQVQLEPIMEAASQKGFSKYTGVGQALKLIVKEEGIPVKLHMFLHSPEEAHTQPQ